MEEFLEVAKVGTTLIHGPPGAGKTSLAMVLASRIANKVMWVSTTEGPNMLKVVADRLNVKKEKIDFLDFPRSFRENIVKYIVDHIQQYEALVIDSINGLARQQEIDLLTHTVFYQISQKTPVIVVAEEKTPKIDYIVDHIIHVWYKINSMGHLIRYAQLEKSRIKPPGPRYIFEILENTGITYVRYRESTVYHEFIEEPIFGKILPKKIHICLHSTSIKNLTEYLSKFENAIFVSLGPWTSFKGITAKETFTIKSFHDLFKLGQYLADKNINYLIVGGLVNLKEDEIPDYIVIMGVFLKYVDFLVLTDVGPIEELKKVQRYCDEIIVV